MGKVIQVVRQRSKEEYDSIIDAVCKQDDEFFRRNPKQVAYERKPVPGEFGLLLDEHLIKHVKVVEAFRGLRFRTPVY
jgi:hypothetical protein